MPEDKLRILLIDDDEDDYLITEDLLYDIGEQRYQLDWVSNYLAATDAIAKREHDIYLVDYRLGQETGLDVMRWAIANNIDTPFILLTGQGDHRVDMEAMEAGAADYLVKGQMDARLLERSIRYAVERHRGRKVQTQLEAELRQSQKMEAIGHMAGGIAHDFNNILTAVMSYVSLAKRQVDEESPVYRQLAGIEETSMRGASLTGQLLTFARRQVTMPRLVNLNDIIMNLDKLLRRLITVDIELVVLPASDVGIVKVDPGQFEQILINMVVNARDAMPDGGKLTISTQQMYVSEEQAKHFVEFEPGEYVILQVGDTGIGMSEEVKSRIFEPFFTTKELGKGTGLGLATCYGIVKQSHGHIDVTSELGVGTTFSIYLPCAQSEQAKAMATAVSAGQSEVKGGKETILVVEDEPVLRKIIAEYLEQHGYQVWTAAHGEDALRLVRDHDDVHLDLLVTDMVMPRLGGTSLAEEMKKRQPDLKIVFMSGYSDETINHQNWLAENAIFIQKPFTVDAFTKEIREFLDIPSEPSETAVPYGKP